MIASSLKGEAKKGLNRWLITSTALLTLGLFAWITFTYLDEVETARRIVGNIISNRSTTFNEVFLQRDLEQFTSARNGSFLTPIDIQVSREGAKVAVVGTKPSWLGLYREWQVETVVRGGVYKVRLGVDLLPAALFYLVFLGGIGITYRTLLRHSFANFDRAVTAVANEFDNVIRELKGETPATKSITHTEFDELRRLSRGWKAELEKYRIEVARLSTAEAESRVAQLVAHDIKSPLSVFKLILGRPKPIAAEERVLLLEASDRITDICEDLVQISKRKVTQVGKQEISEGAINLLWSSISEEKFLEYPDKNVQFSFRNQWPDGAKILCDSSLTLRRTISNLTNNAICAAGSHVALELVLSQNADGLRIELHDNGPGIPQEILANLNNGPISGSAGTGLGLKSAREWMEVMSGGLEIAPKSGGGTVVSMVFH